jgi:hypothetical protein
MLLTESWGLRRPPAKIAGRELAPYLERLATVAA